MIVILCPSRDRPEKCLRMIKSVKGKASILAAVSPEDDERYGFVNRSVMPELLPTAQKWNYLALQAMGNPDNKLFMLGSDDMYFETDGWAEALINHYNSLENKIHVYALQDSRDSQGTPHPIVTREFIDAIGYFVPPVFLHWFVDSWLVDIGKSNQCFTHLRDFKLVHDKPSDDGKADTTHNGIRSYGWRERDSYVAESCKYFLDCEKARLAEKL